MYAEDLEFDETRRVKSCCMNQPPQVVEWSYPIQISPEDDSLPAGSTVPPDVFLRRGSGDVDSYRAPVYFSTGLLPLTECYQVTVKQWSSSTRLCFPPLADNATDSCAALSRPVPPPARAKAPTYPVWLFIRPFRVATVNSVIDVGKQYSHVIAQHLDYHIGAMGFTGALVFETEERVAKYLGANSVLRTYYEQGRVIFISWELEEIFTVLPSMRDNLQRRRSLHAHVSDAERMQVLQSFRNNSSRSSSMGGQSDDAHAQRSLQQLTLPRSSSTTTVRRGGRVSKLDCFDHCLMATYALHLFSGCNGFLAYADADESFATFKPNMRVQDSLVCAGALRPSPRGGFMTTSSNPLLTYTRVNVFRGSNLNTRRDLDRWVSIPAGIFNTENNRSDGGGGGSVRAASLGRGGKPQPLDLSRLRIIHPLSLYTLMARDFFNKNVGKTFLDLSSGMTSTMLVHYGLMLPRHTSEAYKARNTLTPPTQPSLLPATPGAGSRRLQGAAGLAHGADSGLVHWQGRREEEDEEALHSAPHHVAMDKNHVRITPGTDGSGAVRHLHWQDALSLQRQQGGRHSRQLMAFRSRSGRNNQRRTEPLDGEVTSVIPSSCGFWVHTANVWTARKVSEMGGFEGTGPKYAYDRRDWLWPFWPVQPGAISAYAGRKTQRRL